MKPKKQFLTKSRFKIGCECPTKLFYLDNKKYGNNNKDNSFLAALAEGGFQVGELAKIYYPGGVEITSGDKDQAASETAKLLEKENVTIYEASFKFENLFVKADVLIKSGTSIRIIEVKAKGIDPTEDRPFYTKRSLKKGPLKLNSEWEPYIIDISFQTYVLKKAYPNLEVSSFLFLTNKSVVASVDGINQRFFLAKNTRGQTYVSVATDTTKANLGTELLTCINVDAEVAVALDSLFEDGSTFIQKVSQLSSVCENLAFINPILGSNCKGCEFRIDTKKSNSLLSGFDNCWTHAETVKGKDLEKPFVFDIWNFRKSAELLEQGKFLMEQVEEEDISPTSKDVGLSATERQWLQVKKVRDADHSSYLDAEGLWKEMNTWTFPLHFIDFETSMVAIPFNKGRKPYEQMAFQFSHHQVNKNGSVIHQDEYINQEKGIFPNFDFVRALKKSLEGDQGTVFRFAAHENTVLCQIRSQLMDSKEEDRAELISFIESLTKSSDDDAGWEGSRNMVDMCELVKKYYYNPATGGSNSIKKVLPAILNESKYLQGKYAKPIYGTSDFPSKNFTEWTWILKNIEGVVVDPYKLLPPIFSDLDLETMDSLVSEGSIADGGAAMTAYARMQFTEMSSDEQQKVVKALLKYCELDTFAMVVIYECWRHEVSSALGLKEAA